MEIRKIFFYENKFLAKALLVVAVTLLFIGLFFRGSYSFYFSIVDISFLEISLAANIALMLFTAFMTYNNIKNSAENVAKAHALKVITIITSLKLSVSTVDELANLICKKLEEYFEGEFWLFLAESAFCYKVNDSYVEQAKRVLDNPQPVVVREESNDIYFHPIVKGKRKIGILIAKVDKGNGFHYLMRILPDQISNTINNFENSIKLDEAQLREEREKLRSLILSSISHDLKTPLSSIIGGLNIFTNLSKQNKLDEESSKVLIATAVEEAERLKGFISDVLEMTRIESGAIKLQKQFLDSASLIERTVKRFESKLQDYHLEISLNHKIKINCDPTCCEQIIQNLLENTIKFSPKNTKITIWDEVINDHYFISIQDEGGGINPEKLSMIFNKFERFSLEDKILGSGLGLSIVKALMDANNATITAKNSESGKGAIFILEFRDFKNDAENHDECSSINSTYPTKNGANYE